MNSGCKGCVAYSRETGLPCNGTMNDKGECPCSDCLIKGMCENECSAYTKFSIAVYQRQRETDCLEPEYFNSQMRTIE
jgi:hypothetical protein